MTRVAIIGSGPTGIYTLKGLVGARRSLSITVFERGSDAGKGTPYHPHMNDQAMLANIASVELPPVRETLVAWLRRQPDEELLRLNVTRDAIGEREFYPRVVLGEFLQSQFRQLVEIGRAKGHSIDVRANHHVVDIALQEQDIELSVEDGSADRKTYFFDHVVMATGHDWPETTEIKPGYFVSPWPAQVDRSVLGGHPRNVAQRDRRASLRGDRTRRLLSRRRRANPIPRRSRKRGIPSDDDVAQGHPSRSRLLLRLSVQAAAPLHGGGS